MLAAAVLQRMRRLNRGERTLLLRASVIGQRFRVAVLAGVTALEEERVLDQTGMHQFVVRDDERGDWYAFRHALIRDVAYKELVGTQVRPIHRLIARSLERSAGANDVVLDDLAYHSWAAADASRCLRYNERAGDRAAAAFASQDARIYYARALEFAQPDSKHFQRLADKLARLPGDG
jgi:predicted ATPase